MPQHAVREVGEVLLAPQQQGLLALRWVRLAWQLLAELPQGQRRRGQERLAEGVVPRLEHGP